MNDKKTCISVIIKPDAFEVSQSVKDILSFCLERGFIFATLQNTIDFSLVDSRSVENIHICGSIQDVVNKASIVVTLGGDGTLLSVVRFISPAVPLIGIHYGTLGFLTEHMPEELLEVLDSTVKCLSTLSDRPLLEGRVYADFSDDAKSGWSCLSANDIVIQKDGRQQLLEFSVEGSMKGEPLKEILNLRADGLIIATPTGSTAYSLAAGGSIVHPNVGGNLITPINAHSLTMRPLILPSEMELRVRLLTKGQAVIVSADGQDYAHLDSKSSLEISRSSRIITLVASRKRGYFDVLGEKLHWAKGIPRKS